MVEMADGVLAVANGGIFTDPAMERQKLELERKLWRRRCNT